MAYTGPSSGGGNYGDLAGFRAEGREPGARRKKLAGYLKAANELRASYFEQSGNSRETGDQDQDSAFPDAAVVRRGNEEMILFPSYARRHVKSKPKQPGEEGNDADYWRQTWEQHESDKAIVDVDVRGWVYSPQRGPTTRRQRLFIGLARQMCGLPAPAATQNGSADNSKSSSRASSSDRNARAEEDLINLEAENILKRGMAETERAERGSYSENPNRRQYSPSIQSRNSSPDRGRQGSRLSQATTLSPDDYTPLQKRSSWPQPTKMSAAELAVANAHLLTRLKPFMSNPLAETPISAFFYNENVSRQRTVYTDSSGHFTCRAPLDFVPTHVRVLAGEGLSATEEVNITAERGVSLISDIDDTIKHSGISHGAREIFRNAFIRDLGDMSIDGVREWYTTLHDMGVKLHYVSNSPWQMYPVLTSYFNSAHLPAGSFHLKQYSGYLQGIFEPVAERKKSTLDKLMRDFPDRKFILVGDSGEADLEVYTEVVIDNPGRILGVFIRDVTTTVKTGYFDGPGSGQSSGRPQSRNHSRNKSGDSLGMSKRLSRPGDIRDDDADLQAAIAMSLADMEEEARRARQAINPDTPAYSHFNQEGRRNRPQMSERLATSPGVSMHHHATSPEEDLIDFSEEAPSSKPWLRPSPSESNLASRRKGTLAEPHKHTPSPPPKPSALRSPSPNSQSRSAAETLKPPPPRPRKPSSAVKQPSQQSLNHLHHQQIAQPSPLSQVQRQNSTNTPPPLPSRPNTYRGIAKQTIASVYNAMPTPGWHATDPSAYRAPTSGSNLDTPRAMSTFSTHSAEPLTTTTSSTTRSIAAPPIPPPRRVGSTQSFATMRSKQQNRMSSTSGYSDDGQPGSPGDGMSKKELLWNQRWQRAKSVMDRSGVTLRSWRVGADVADVCVRLVEMEEREIEKERKKKGGNGDGDGR